MAYSGSVVVRSLRVDVSMGSFDGDTSEMHDHDGDLYE